jgi:hypothetical protein
MKEKEDVDFFYFECQRPSFLWLAFELILFVVYIYKYVICINETAILGMFISHNSRIVYSVIVPLIIILLPYCFSIKTIINNEGVYVKRTPFQIRYKFFNWDYISKAYIRKYKPFREFGGWGKSKKSTTMSGNMGIQLEFIDGKNLLIGTRRSQDVAFALENLKKFSEENGRKKRK